MLREFPLQASLWFSSGHALMTEGRGNEAVQAYRRSVELEPGFGEAWWSLANLQNSLRAGSTLVEQILSSHSQVEGTMELQEIMAITSDLRGMSAAPESTAYTEVLATLDAARLRGLGERYLQRTRIHRKLGKPFFIGKMPNNFSHIGLIQLILPNARIIDARRQ